MRDDVQIIKPTVEVAELQKFDNPTSYGCGNHCVGSMTHEIQARRQRGDVFVIVIPGNFVKLNTENGWVKFVLNQTDDGFDCTCGRC